VPVKIVTDSAADIPPAIVRELGITIVPAYVNFGTKSYRDGVDIGCDEFYDKLTNGSVYPSTSQPTPSDFAAVYRRLGKETDEIISIHMSDKFSGTFSSAQRGRTQAAIKGKITMIDTGTITMALGIIVMSAARLALLNRSPAEIVDNIQQGIKNTRLLGTFDTLKYLARGGRIGKGKALLGSILNVKPVVTIHDGAISPVGNFRTRTKAVDKLVAMVQGASGVQELAIVHSTTPDEAQNLKIRLSSFVDINHIYSARLGPAIGVHTGPGTLVLVIRDSGGKTEAAESSSKPLVKRPSLRLPKINLPTHRQV
jgi:DegV family protein with EDD domain